LQSFSLPMQIRCPAPQINKMRAPHIAGWYRLNLPVEKNLVRMPHIWLYFGINRYLKVHER
jgi:hypothetical protein